MAASLKRPNLWLYLQFPLLPLEALTRAEPDTDQTAAAPRAVITARGNPRRVLCCNLAAEQCGLEAEMVLPTALAICPELRTLPRQTDSEQALLQHLVLVAYRFSPEVIIDQAGGLWLELSGCEKLLGGFTPLLQALDQAINQPPLAIASGFGVSPEAARLLSRPGFQTRVPGPEILRRQLAAAPLAKLDTSVRKQADLAKLGFDTVGDLLALPNKVLGRRFGAAFLEQLARLTGRQPCRWPRFQPPSYFEDSLQHPDGIQNKEGLLFPMKALLQRFCHYLMARQCHCQAMQWGFEPLLGEPVTITVQLTSGQNRWSSLLAISRLQLERLALPGSIEMIRLTSRQLAPAPGDTPDLFSGADGQRNDSELLDTLRARLGVEALSQPVLNLIRIKADPNYLEQLN